MLKNHQCKTVLSFVALVTVLLVLPATAADVPAVLPDPDGQPGDTTKPVKVYIMAGQSNMVGMDFSFDPQEPPAKKDGPRYRKVTYPAGMEDWFAPDFDPATAGWKKGLPPFGQLGGTLEPLGKCDRSICGCGEKPRTLWEKEVLLIRGTFEFPPLQDGHRYRIVVGGSDHVNAGEGYAIYVNGKLLAESKVGVAVRQGGQPRGGHIDNQFRDEFKHGKATIAAISFLRYNHPRIKPYPPRGHITVWMEEQKIPPVAKAVASDQ